MQKPIDIVMCVPFQPFTGHVIEPLYRQTLGGEFYMHVARGFAQLSSYLGRDLRFVGDDSRPVFDGEVVADFAKHRSLTAIALATHLEAAGLGWAVLDPGQQELGWWRKELSKFRKSPPACVGISTTFALGGRWLRALCAVVRELLPTSKILIGGYYYTSDAADFLSIDADVYVVGAGEQRIEELVARIRDGRPLESLPGLFLRRSDGSLFRTPDVEQPHLVHLPAPDWRLAERITPPVLLTEDVMDYALETQRGCVFKCEFCTYRTLAEPDFLGVDASVERILATKASPRGIIRLTDSTATFPHERWRHFMERLAEKGGAPHPLWAYARVNDIDEETAALMAKAGVKEVFIGQESGDQRVLQLMRKGTHVSQVKPALAALQKHGIWAVVSFIHGFPGEDAESIQRTREMIVSMNEGLDPGSPAAAWYNVNPFLSQDFAAVAEKTDTRAKGTGYLGFDPGGKNSSRLMAVEALATFLAAARRDDAPAFVHVLTLLDSPRRGAVEPEPSLMRLKHRTQFQRWVKAVEQGIAVFVEANVEGKRLDVARLAKIRERVLAPLPKASFRTKFSAQTVMRVAPIAGALAQREWLSETSRGIGPFTRLGLAAMRAVDGHSLGSVFRALKTGEYHPRPATTELKVAEREAGDLLAVSAIKAAQAGGHKRSEAVRAANAEGVRLPVVPPIH